MSEESKLHDQEEIFVSHNEIRENNTILNRNIRYLLENDVRLNEFHKSIAGDVEIKSYDSNYSYKTNDLIWYLDENKTLFLLRSLVPDNTSKPINQHGIFDDSGWHNEFEQVNILDFELSSTITTEAQNSIVKHQKNTDYHVFGKVTYEDPLDSNYIGNKILKSNVGDIDSNADTYRETVKYPYLTKYLEKDNVIVNGFYRRYDFGLIEYDLIFKVGYSGETDFENYGSKTIIGANNFKLNQPEQDEDLSVILNSNGSEKYFYGNCYDIFFSNNTEYDGTSEIGSLVQKNRNDNVNAYYGHIHFPQHFYDTNYCIFCSNVMCQTIDGKNPTQSQNSLVFCDKTVRGVNVVYLQFNKDAPTAIGKNAQDGGLICNSFHCRFVGKCQRI